MLRYQKFLPSILFFSICTFSALYPAAELSAVTNAAEEKFYPITGTLYPVRVSKISSEVAGRITEILGDVGKVVTKDQILIKLDPFFFETEYQKLENAVKLAKIAYDDANREFGRMKNLWEKEGDEKPSISKKQFEDAMTLLKQKEILLNQSLLDLQYQKKRLDETSIKAPYSGVITKRFVDKGESITTVPLVHLIEIMDISKLIFEFSLSQDLSTHIEPGLIVVAEVEGQSQPFEGVLETIFPNVDETNRCFKCRVILDNENGLLKPGCFVKGKIKLKS